MKKKTNYAILGVLTLGPQSGYDIKKFIGESIGHFWQESYGQLYPTLKSLVGQSLLEMQIEKTDGKPDKKVYSITSAGRTVLKEWLQNPVESLPKFRSELLLKLFFGSEIHTDINIQHIELHKNQCQGSLLVLEGIKKMIQIEHKQHPASKFWLITLSNGIHGLKAQINWAAETLIILQGVK